MLASLASMAADNKQQYVPSSFGGWQNLSASVNDITYYTNDQLPMQAAVSGKTIHVFWADWKANAKGNYCVYYRRSTDAGKTWEDARAIVASPKLKMVDINYLGGNFGTNAKWYNVEGNNVQIVTVQESNDEKNSELYLTHSQDGGKTFKTRQLLKGDENIHFGRPHVVSDGQTLVIAFQQGRYSSRPYHTRVLTSFDGGQTFSDKEIDLSQEFGDLQVSGKRWAVLGAYDDWNNGMLRGNVYISTSTDGGKTISTQNVAPIVVDKEREGWDDRSWGSLEYMKGHNGSAYNYHPLFTLEGDVINVVFRGCAQEVEGKRPTNDRNHTIFRRSTDGGKTWSKAIYLPSSNGSNCTIAAKDKHIYVLQVINGPLMTYSHDGGKTWEIQERSFWRGSSNGFGNFYELYIAPDDATGQHVYMTGVRGMLAESKDGFRTVERNFSIGKESFYGGRSNNHSLTVLVDSEGTEHWVMNYQAPYKNFDSYFWNVVYRRNDPAPATTGKEMAFDISKKVYSELTQKIVNDITIPMTPSIMATRDATTVECWVRVDETDYSFEIASVTHSSATHEGSRYNGGWFIHANKSGNWYTFYAGLSTELSVDGVGKQVSDSWRYQIKDRGYWHHVALTYDSKQEKDNLCFYIDGVLISKATEKGKIAIGNNPIVIGRTSTYGENQKALVDNFAIWSRALTQEEIQAHIYNTPDGKDKDCRLLLTFDGSLQDKSQYHNDPAPLMDAILVGHDGIRPPHPEFTMAKEMKGQKVNVSDMTQDGVGCWWVLPYPGKTNDYKTSEQRHVSQDFSRNPGTYTYTLVAKGTGKNNAYASTTQSITIGGLSKVTPEVAAQSDYTRLRILGGYKLNNSNKPKVVLHSDKGDYEGQWLMNNGDDASKAQSIDELPYAQFDLSKAPLGKYDVVVGTDTLYKAFELIKPEEPEVWVRIGGRDKALAGKYQQLFIEYGNTSNVDAYNVPIYLIYSGDDNFDLKFDFEYRLYTDAIDDDIRKIVDEQFSEPITFVDHRGKTMRGRSFLIPYIPANSSGQKSFRIKGTTTATQMELYLGWEEPLGTFEESPAHAKAREKDEWDDYFNEIRNNNPKDNYDYERTKCKLQYLAYAAIDAGIAGVEWGLNSLPVVSCVWGGIKTGISTYQAKPDDKWIVFTESFAWGAVGCATGFVSTVPAFIGFCIQTTFNMVSAYNGAKSCTDPNGSTATMKIVSSYDPNEMIGPWGPDDKAHYIQPIHQMPYTITFENKASASAPAHEVLVYDKLDASKYDLSTFSFNGFGWADKSFVVGGSKIKEFTRDVTYNVKGQDILVRVSGQFDEKTGIVRWSFVSLKKNGEEIDDPDLGFLVPNNDNRDGEGFVSFIIEHKANPANGSTISNKATIIFDANEPIETNAYLNTFDTDYPTSKITKVEEKQGQLVVTVSGSDATSGIGAYHIYAFKNGDAAEKVATIMEGNQATFACDPGTKYGLCVIATDKVGWNEAKNIKAEVEVTTTVTGINDALIDDPANSDYIDLQGRHVKEPTAPGIYIQNGKKVLIKKLVQEESE